MSEQIILNQDKIDLSEVTKIAVSQKKEYSSDGLKHYYTFNITRENGNKFTAKVEDTYAAAKAHDTISGYFGELQEKARENAQDS